MSDDLDRTASLMTPAKLAQLKPKPAASPSAYLNQLASDAGGQHVRRLVELRDELEAQAKGRNFAPCGEALAALDTALDGLDYSLLQQNKGLLARVTGKGKSAGAEFVNQYDRIVEACEAVRAQAQALAARHQSEAAATERTLLEFEVEFRGIEKIIDQGARWLQDMRNQLKARQAEAGADAAALARVKEDAARCELLVTRLKLLRATSTGAQQAHQLAQAAAARRAALLQMLQQRIAADVKALQARVAPIAAAAGDSGSPALSLEGPKETQRELKQHLQEAVADCGQLQVQEQSLADSVAALREQLHAAM